jgi:hypothetical protein
MMTIIVDITTMMTMTTIIVKGTAMTRCALRVVVQFTSQISTFCSCEIQHKTDEASLPFRHTLRQRASGDGGDNTHGADDTVVVSLSM